MFPLFWLVYINIKIITAVKCRKSLKMYLENSWKVLECDFGKGVGTLLIIYFANVVKLGRSSHRRWEEVKQEGKKFFPRCNSVCMCVYESQTHIQCVGLHTSLPLWHHHQWQRARDNREELNSEGKLSLFLSVGWTGKQDVNTLSLSNTAPLTEILLFSLLIHCSKCFTLAY